MDKDPVGWQTFRDQLAAGSARGHSLTMQGVQMKRPSVFDLGVRRGRLDVPTLGMTGDEEDRCLEPGIFRKRKIPTAARVLMRKAGHAINPKGRAGSIRPGLA